MVQALVSIIHLVHLLSSRTGFSLHELFINCLAFGRVDRWHHILRHSQLDGIGFVEVVAYRTITLTICNFTQKCHIVSICCKDIEGIFSGPSPALLPVTGNHATVVWSNIEHIKPIIN